MFLEFYPFSRQSSLAFFPIQFLTTTSFFQVNHAVTVVGYDAKVFVIKNSWGSAWGEKGYINFDRKISNQCFIGQYPEYPNLVLTGEDEDDSEVCDIY